MEEVKLLTEKDCLIALHNYWMEKLIQAKANILYFEMKQKKFRNGEKGVKEIKKSILTAQNNVENNQEMVTVIKQQIKSLS